MQTRTTADLVKDVLIGKLSEVGATETPEAQDAKAVQDKYSDVYAELVDEGIAYWDDGEIPVVVFDRVSSIVANRVAPAFGRPYDEGYDRLMISKLKKHVAKSASKLPIPAEYF